AVRQSQIPVVFHTLQQRAVAAQAAAVQTPGRQLVGLHFQLHLEALRAIGRNDNRRRRIQLHAPAGRVVGVSELRRDTVSARGTGVVPNRDGLSERAVV